MALPLLFLVLGAYITFMVGKADQAKTQGILAGVTASVFSALSLISAVLLALEVWENDTAAQTFGGGILSADALGVFLILVACALTLAVSVYSVGYMREESRKEHFFPLLLLMTAGITGIGLSTDLFTLYVFYELMCIASYVLVAFKKDKWDAVEAGMKYIVLSAAGSAFALFGIALTYAQFQTLDMTLIISGLVESSGGQMALVSVLLLIVGFGVKAAIVPLHTWLPDAHSAAPSGISAMLSGIVIETGFIVLLRALLLYSGIVSFGELLIVLAVITMCVGNVMAFVQIADKNADLKRVLAYSSIGQVGYIIMGIGLGLAYGVEMGYRGGVFHIMTHAIMKGLAFLCAGAIIYRLGTRNIDKMRGIGHVMPVTAFAFSIAALSLAGAPPLGGFMSEWMIFKAGVDASAVIGWVGVFLSLILLLNSVLSLGYYLPIIKAFFLEPNRKWSGIKETPPVMLIPIVLLAAIIVTLGIWPELGMKAVEPVVEFLMRFGGA